MTSTALAETPADPRSKKLSANKQIIAIVDDDPSVLRGLKRVLEASHFSTDVFSCAEEFLGHHPTSPVACIVLDIHLGGMSGIEMRRRLIEMGSSTPVIFMTSHDSPAFRKEASAVGCAGYLQKPFSIRVLIDTIRNAISAA